MSNDVQSATVRLSAFSDPRDRRQILVSLSESSEGASRWEVTNRGSAYRPLRWDYARLLYTLSKDDEDEDGMVARRMGESLFETFCTDAIRNKLQEARASAKNQHLRIAIDVTADLIGIPWELLHDGNDFLLKQNCSIVRVVAQLPPGVAYFGPITRIALVSVTPDFDAREHVAGLEKRMTELGVGVVRCEEPTRRDLRRFLDTETIDAMYFLGHGKQGSIIMRPESDRGLLDGGDLGSWFPDPARSTRRVNLVYLNSCGTAERRPDENVLSGVAQRLMLSRRVGTVVAMQAKIGIQHAFRIAEGFLEDVVSRGDPEAALRTARTDVENICARSIPVIYTHVEGVREFRRNRLSRLLGAVSGEKVALSLPGLKLGVKPSDYGRVKDGLLKVMAGEGVTFFYRGETYAQGDVHAAKEVLNLLTEIGQLDNVTICNDEQPTDCPVAFFFGGHSHDKVLSLMKEYAGECKIERDEKAWAIVDMRHARRYEMASPVRTDIDYRMQDDWGIIEKVVMRGRCYFFLCGLGDRATRGCAHVLSRQWEELLAKYRDRPFAELVRFPGGLDHTEGVRVDRAKAEYGVPMQRG